MARRIVSLLLGMMLLPVCRSLAIAPPYVSDEQLAQYPVIVVAQWDKAKVVRHDRYIAWNAVDRIEAYTTLNVLRVIEGSISPGNQPVMIGSSIAWTANGKRVSSGTSTEMSGDATDITKPCLWFLKKKRSWDEKDSREYPLVDHYREIQPLVLEKYFVALNSWSPRRKVPALLGPDRPEVSWRVLRYISGGIWPWPYDSNDEFMSRIENPEKRGELLRGEAQRVWQVVASDAPDDLRARALAVYTELEGKDCVKPIRTLLQDKDPAVRGVAVGILTRHRDSVSLDQIPGVVKGVVDPELACKIIGALLLWRDDRVVPALAACLENDGFAYQMEDNLAIPALKARDALHEMTGHWFPFDAVASVEAWKQAQQLPQAQRQDYLQRTLPGQHYPLQAELVSDLGYHPEPPAESESARRYVTAVVRLRNVTTRPVAVTTRPSSVSASAPNGMWGCRLPVSNEVPSEKDFATIQPGKTLEFEITVPEDFLSTDPATRKMQALYQSLAKRKAGTGWIGMLDIRIASARKEE